MGLTNEHIGPKILAKIQIYFLTRAKLLFQVCYEIPCSTKIVILDFWVFKVPFWVIVTTEILPDSFCFQLNFLKRNLNVFIGSCLYCIRSEKELCITSFWNIVLKMFEKTGFFWNFWILFLKIHIFLKIYLEKPH